MNLRLGIYDLFSRIVPGGFYLLAFVEFARVFGWLELDWRTVNDIGLLLSLGLLGTAYTLGFAMDRLGYFWHLIFRKRGLSNRALERFKQLHQDKWVINFEDKDFPVLRAYIYIRNPSVAEEIDRFNALSIMLRNLSFGLALFTVSEVIRFLNTNDWRFLLLALLLLFFSYQVAIHARNQRTWFYSNILEVITAYRLDLEEQVKPVKPRKKTRQVGSKV
jgi:hypothetical protein